MLDDHPQQNRSHNHNKMRQSHYCQFSVDFPNCELIKKYLIFYRQKIAIEQFNQKSVIQSNIIEQIQSTDNQTRFNWISQISIGTTICQSQYKQNSEVGNVIAFESKKTGFDNRYVAFIIVEQKLNIKQSWITGTSLKNIKYGYNSIYRIQEKHSIIITTNQLSHKKIVLQIINRVQSTLMTSPYSMRVRLPQSLITSQHQFPKIFENSPRTSCKKLSEFETNISQKMGSGVGRQFISPQMTKTKITSQRSMQSYSQPSNIQLHSNSINEQSINQGKYKRGNIYLENIEHQIHNNMSDINIVPVQLQMQKYLEKIGTKLTFDDQLIQNKKSYRKNNGVSCFGVPYRKCHSAMQEKVVSIINKIKSGKDCHKEIQTLMDRTKKVPLKQLHNKYFVSGIQLLSNLVIEKEYKDMFSSQLVSIISDGLEDLKSRVLAELDNTKGFEVEQVCNEEVVYEKLQLVRRAYRVLRKKLRSLQREEVQNKALSAADWFIENKVNNLHLFYEELGQTQC